MHTSPRSPVPTGQVVIVEARDFARRQRLPDRARLRWTLRMVEAWRPAPSRTGRTLPESGRRTSRSKLLHHGDRHRRAAGRAEPERPPRLRRIRARAWSRAAAASSTSSAPPSSSSRPPSDKASSTAAGSNRGSSTIACTAIQRGVHLRRLAGRVKQRKRDEHGIDARRGTRSNAGRKRSAVIIAFMIMFMCVSSAPFGSPVVPDV